VPGPTLTVQAYLGRLPDGHRATLEAILQVIAASFPELGVRLAWNVPHVTWGDRYVAGLSSSKDHVSLSPWSQAVLDAHRDRLGGLESTRNLIRIPPGWKVDRNLIRDLVTARLAELREPKPRPDRRKPTKGLPRRPR
jgi:uncharacterized protein